MKKKTVALMIVLSLILTLVPAQAILAEEVSDEDIATYGAFDGLKIEAVNDGSFYTVDVQTDYQLDDLLCENIYTAEDLSRWMTSHLYRSNETVTLDMGDGGACSAFVAKDQDGNLLYARNYDYLQDAQNALVHTNPSDGYESVSMAAAGWVIPKGKKLDLSPSSAYSLPYLAMDGMNEKGVMISVLKLDGDGVRLEDSSKSAIIPNIYVRVVLDRADDVESAIALLNDYNLCSSMEYANFHYFIADASGKCAIIEVSPEDGSMTVDRGNLHDDATGTENRQITNFYKLYPSQDYHLDDGLHGLNRYMNFVRQLDNCDYTMSKEGAMALLEEAYQDNRLDAIHETQWSVVYSPGDMTVNVSPRYDTNDDRDRFYSRQYQFDVSGLGSGSVNLSPDRKEGDANQQSLQTGLYEDGERSFNVASNTITERAGGQTIADVIIDTVTGEWTEAEIIQKLKEEGEEADLFELTYKTGTDAAVVTSDAGTTQMVTFDGTLQGLIDVLDTDSGCHFMIQAMGDIELAADEEAGREGTIIGDGQSVVLQMNGYRLYNADGNTDFALVLQNLHLAIDSQLSLAENGIQRILLNENGYMTCNEGASNDLVEVASNWENSLIGYGSWKNVERIAVDRIIGGHFYNTYSSTKTTLDVNTIAGGIFGQNSSVSDLESGYPLVVNSEIKEGSFLDTPVLDMESGKILGGTYACEVILGDAEIADGVFKNVVTAQFNGDTTEGYPLGESIISGGKFLKPVINRGIITGGVFVDTLQNDVAAGTDDDGYPIEGGKGGEITGGIFKDKENITGSQPQTLTFRQLKIEDALIQDTGLAGTVNKIIFLDVIPGTEVTLSALGKIRARFYCWETSLTDYMTMDNLVDATITFIMPDSDSSITASSYIGPRDDYQMVCAPTSLDIGDVMLNGDYPERVISFKNIGKKHIASWKYDCREEYRAYDVRVEVDNDDNRMYRNSIGRIYVSPVAGLDACSYSDAVRLYFYDEDGNEVCKKEINLMVRMVDYGIRVNESYLHFGQVEEGGTWPEAQELHLFNKGVNVISGWKLTSNAETSAFTFSQTTGDIEAGYEATVSVQPKADLSVGVYEEILTISYDEDQKVTVPVYFEVQAKKILCEGKKEVKLSEGTHQMTIGGTDVGTYTFAGANDKWSIQNVDGKYIGFKENALSYDDTPFQWMYKNNMFYTTVTEKQSSSGGGWWSWGGWGQKEKTVTVNWFLNAEKENTLTVSKAEAKAKFYDQVSADTHSFGKWQSDENDGHHRTCEVCGETESGTCSYDENTHKCTVCGATDPANASVYVDVNITKKTGSSGGGWWFWSRPSKTTWTAAITVTGEGVDIQKVEYSTDQENYQTGTSFTSDTEIKTFYIRVTDSNDNVTNWIYENGTVKAL